MPELPDVTVYVERLQAKLGGQVLREVRLQSIFVLRTAMPPIAAREGRTVTSVERLGKRIVLGFDDGVFVVIHLMIAGRLRWADAAARLPAAASRAALALFRFEHGQLVLTEAGTTRRASIHVLADRAALHAMDPGGIDPMRCDAAAFAAQLARENHTLKRSLTDPRLFSGIGNAYSDEILHRARLSPVALTRALAPADAQRLFEATRSVLHEWTERLRAEAGDWPQKVTAFHAQMAVHGRYGQPCPACGSKVQRIVYASNETNYCARCQTGGKLLADRALSTLLKASWPRHIDDIDP